MATYHCTVKVGGKGKASPHASYLIREGKYENLRSGEKLEYVEHGNMPNWAVHQLILFWENADQFERANGATYREIEVALPRELTPVERVELVQDFVKNELGDRHAYTFAIHNPIAALDGGEQPHAHIMYSERIIDNHERDPERYFKRYNAKEPERGGCQKANVAKTQDERKEALIAQRERWAITTNKHLELAGHEVRVDHRSLKDQGIERSPERHFGGKGVRLMSEKDISDLLEHRRAEGEKERAQENVSGIDLSYDIAAAKRERDFREAQILVQQRAEEKKREELKAKLDQGADAFVKKYEAMMKQKELEQLKEIERQRELERSRDRGMER